MVNILISYISLYTRGFNANNEKYYEVYRGTERLNPICAFQTNEACLKCLKALDINIDHIISMTTAEVNPKTPPNPDPYKGTGYRDTYDYYTRKVTEIFGDELSNNITTIETPSSGSPEDSFRNLSTAIYNKVKELTNSHINNARIILDFSGGQRDVIVFLQMLTKMFEYYGCNVDIYYVFLDQRSGVGSFYSCNSIYNQMKILDAVNMFVNTGNAEPLKDFFGTLPDAEKENIPDEVTRLINAMITFNNNIIMCSVKALNKHVDKIKTALTALEGCQSDNQYVETLKIMSEKIKEKFYFNRRFSYENMIRWCLENGLLQQALTIFAENIPDYLFNYKNGSRYLHFIVINENYRNLVKKKYGGFEYKRAFQYIFELLQPPRIVRNNAGVVIENNVEIIKNGICYWLKHNKYPENLDSYWRIWVQQYCTVIAHVKCNCETDGIISKKRLSSMIQKDTMNSFHRYLLKNIRNGISQDISFNEMIMNDQIYIDTDRYESGQTNDDTGSMITCRINDRTTLSYYIAAQFIMNSHILDIVDFRQYLCDAGLTISNVYFTNDRIYRIIRNVQHLIEMRNGTAHSNGNPNNLKEEMLNTIRIITCSDT